MAANGLVRHACLQRSSLYCGVSFVSTEPDLSQLTHCGVDNASTDGTETIAKEIAQSESRLDVVSRPTIWRIQLAAAEVETDYFMWAAGHDLWSPDLVSSCVAALEAKPSAVIAYGACEWIDETVVIDRYTGFGDTSDRAPLERFFTTLGATCTRCWAFRQSALRRAKLSADP